MEGASAAEPPMRASSLTASSRFHAAARYSGVQPSRSRAAGSQPCEAERLWGKILGALEILEAEPLGLRAEVRRPKGCNMFPLRSRPGAAGAVCRWLRNHSKLSSREPHSQQYVCLAEVGERELVYHPISEFVEVCTVILEILNMECHQL